MRLSGQNVVYDTKDLGGQLVFCRRHTNKVVRARATVQAWPKALHGISTTIFGSDHVHKLRTKALRAWDGPIRECTRCYSFHACVTFAVNQGTGVCGKQSTHSADLLMSCPAMKFWITWLHTLTKG